MNCCGTNSPPHQDKFDAGQEKEQKPINNPAPKDVKNGAGIVKSSLILGLALVLIAGMSIGYFIKPSAPSEDHLSAITKQDVASQREIWISLADNIRGQMAREGMYNCCLLKPCWYCIYKDPKHGEGAACDCRNDILNGKHPCGECIGEILEGNGLPELKPYYAKAIAEEVGQEHLVHLENIINDVYSEKSGGEDH